MKEILKHKIDRLMEKAIVGNSEAQLELAREFKRGWIVEKSIDNARYWAFKAIEAGNDKAMSFYNSIASDYSKTVSEIINQIFAIVKVIPWIEFVIAMFMLIITNDNVITDVFETVISLGFFTLLLMYLFNFILCKCGHLPENIVKGSIVVLCHVVAIIIIL